MSLTGGTTQSRAEQSKTKAYPRPNRGDKFDRVVEDEKLVDVVIVY